MHTVAELPEYLRKAENLLSEAERKEVINHLAEHPKSGVLIQGAGGIRKMRWSRGAKGKSGGVRVVYFYYYGNMLLYLLTIFGKGEKTI